MKRKILIALITVFIVGGFSLYKYVFKGPRDVKNESAEFTLMATKLKSEFSDNQASANVKYLGKVIVISGKITEKTDKSFTLDNGVVCVLGATEKSSLSVNSSVKIKGKVDGYDDLFEQVKLTESSIVN